MPRKKDNTPSEYKVLDEKDMPDWVADPTRVDENALTSYRNLKGTQYAMSKRHPGGWGDDELRQFIVDMRQSQIVMTINKRMETDHIDDENDQQVSAIVEEYLKRFADPTPNDMVSLREMARIQLLLEMINDRIKHLVGNNEAIRAKDFETLTKVKKDALGAFQQLEKALGIDRTAREEETDVVSMFSQIKTQAKELLAKRQHSIICYHCELEGVKINYGFIVFHLEGQTPFQFEFTCPRCKQAVFIFRSEKGFTESSLTTKPQVIVENVP